ncbi:MAG: hypothetical protein M8357_13460 [Desulfobulbaceae bacterium]|nr:hypothetical protein [Desulfobulbaceae bacterium]
MTSGPALTIEYTDPLEDFKGWLVMDTLDHRLSAGGMRVQPGLTLDRLTRMARNMTCKMRICGLRVDGAKSGIDYDPAAPGKQAAMARFMAAVSPYIMNRYSMGPDLNVEMAELDAIGRDLGLPSVKMAVARAQGWDLPYFEKRYQVLGQEIDGRPLGKLRAGYGVAVAALAVLDYLGISREKATVAIQGFGALARAAAYGLSRNGVRIIAFADQEKCVLAEQGHGLEVLKLLQSSGTMLPESGYASGVKVTAREAVCRVPCDILVPAAVENTITGNVAGDVSARAVVPGANLAVTGDAVNLLHQRGILVLPDLLTGSGGSLSMEGLFAPKDTPAPAEVLSHVEERMTQLVNQILWSSKQEKISPTRAALRMCSEFIVRPGTRPYGDID